MYMIDYVLIAMFIEAVVSAIKPLWSKDGERMSVAEMVSLGLGVVLALVCRMNVMVYMVDWDVLREGVPGWMDVVFRVMTGVAIGRGPSFLWDLWQRMRETAEKKLPIEGEIVGGVDVEISHWTLEQLRSFCELNGVPAEGCETREDYMDAIEHWGQPQAAEDSLD